MKKFTHKLIAILLCVAMIGSWLPMSVHAEGTEIEYTLYPTPHSVSYGDGSFELKDINAIYGEGVDDYTKARLEETAELKGFSVTEAEAADAEKTNVYVAIYGSGDAVESYILAAYTVDAALFEKTDAHFVAANDGEIVVLGKDTDSCFYGLTTLYQIFGQLTADTLRNVTINDYADVASRGFIEGYYGNPWSTEDRAALMEWGGYYKLNSYFYAPKDDPKHNSAWRELYTDEQLETLIRPLAEAGNASKCRFVFALHPYMYNPIRHSSEATYLEDLAVLQAKFEQVISVGVRQIAILADDAANVGSSNYIRLLEDMTDWLTEMREEYPDLKLLLPFVTQEYMSYGQSYYRNFPENIQIVMTGGQVWGYASQSFTNSFYNNVGRGAYMWINWPCTDNSKNHLIMGGYADFLHPGVDPTKIEGIVLNPMQQSEPSKVAIFGNACYTWNIWESREEADAAWEASFSCVNHKSIVPNDASEALKELSKHMINQNMTNGVVNLQESVAIRDEMNAFKSKLSAGTYTQEEIDSLVEEFTILKEAAITFREEGNERIANQIVYWLDCWDDTTVAVISYLNALSAILNGEADAVIWDHYATGQAAFESSTTHALWYMDHFEYAEVGVQHIVPFMEALHKHLSRYVLDIVDPSGGLSGGRLNMAAFEGGVVSSGYGEGGHYSGSLENLVDGNLSTYLWYDNVGQVDQYVGVDLGKVTAIENVTFTQDATDRFTNYEVQFSTDGKNYTTYGTYSDAVLRLELVGEGINARYVRFYNLTETTKWTKIYEIAVNTEEETEQLSLSAFDGNIPGYYSGNVAKVVDGDTSSYVWYNNNGRVGQYIGVDLGSVVKVGNVTFTQDAGDHFSDYTLQYSTDGVTYTNYETYSDAVLNVDLSSDGIEARYLRFYNNASTSVWIKIYEIAVTLAPETSVLTNSAALKSWNTRITADTAALLTSGELTLAPGEYIGFDLGRIKDLATITVDDQAELTLQVSVNNVDWIDVDAGEVDVDGRYVRLINLTDADVTTTLNDFTVTSTEYSGPYLYDTDIGIESSWGVAEDCRHNGAAFDGDVTTITEFGDLPQEGQYIIYDLGQEREIYKLEIYCTDGALNYIRDAEMAISNDLTEWTTVLTIGDGVENTDDANVRCIDSDAGYSQATSTHPNYVSIEGEVEVQTARYIRILMTATNNNRAVVFNEIEINDGEYVSVSNDPTFEITDIEVQGYPPQNMIDGDLTTSWKPDTTEAGSMVYTFSDDLQANRINIVQKTESNARVYLYAENEGQREWLDMGILDKSLVTLACDNDLNLALKIEWDADSVPNITEIVRYTYIPHEHHYEAVVTEATCTEGGYTTYTCECGDSYVADETEALGHDYETVVTEAT